MNNFVFKKKYGQNFISDKNLLGAIVKDAVIEKDDCVLEIGAGAGSLTQILSESCKHVVSFEIDNDLQAALLALKLENVEFVFGDFMNADIKEIEKHFSKPFKVVANLPYYITTPIIFKLLENCTSLQSLTIMVQKEVAERICAEVGGKDYGILTVMTNFYGTPKITRKINRQMFFPVPTVDSALLKIDIEKNKFEGVDNGEFLKFVKACFSMRRKTLLNNLSNLIGRERLKTIFDEKTLGKRAEQFSISEFIELFKKAFEK